MIWLVYLSHLESIPYCSQYTCYNNHAMEKELDYASPELKNYHCVETNMGKGKYGNFQASNIEEDDLETSM